jgi:hypothetical protein
MDLAAIKARQAWVAGGGHKDVRDIFKRLKKSLKAFKDPRTRKKHAEILAQALDQLSISDRPTEVEAVRNLRAACLLLGVRGGIPGDPLPTDHDALRQVVVTALALVPVSPCKPATKVNAWAAHVAAANAHTQGIEGITRDTYKAVVGGTEAEPEGLRGAKVSDDAVERNASRLKAAATCIDTPLGKVAGTFRPVQKTPGKCP